MEVSCENCSWAGPSSSLVQRLTALTCPWCDYVVIDQPQATVPVKRAEAGSDRPLPATRLAPNDFDGDLILVLSNHLTIAADALRHIRDKTLPDDHLGEIARKALRAMGDADEWPVGTKA